MRINESLESIRDFSFEMFHAGRLAVAQVLEKIDTAIADKINGPEDE